MSIPARWENIGDWQRIVSQKLSPILQGYPYPSLSAEPASVNAGFTYYDTTTNKVRTFDGTVFNDHW